MGLKEKTGSFEFWRISAGAIRKTTTEDDPQAKAREFTDKDTGEKKIIYEIVMGSIEGKIENVEVFDGKFGQQLFVDINDGLEQFRLQVPWESSYTRTFLERLPNVNVAEDVEIIPYAFTDEKGKKRSGLNITQKGEKIKSAVKVYDADGNFMEWVDGFPHFVDNMDKQDIKIMGAMQMKWYKKNVVDEFPFSFKNGIEDEKATEEDKEDISGSDLPF